MQVQYFVGNESNPSTFNKKNTRAIIILVKKNLSLKFRNMLQHQSMLTHETTRKEMILKSWKVQAYAEKKVCISNTIGLALLLLKFESKLTTPTFAWLCSKMINWFWTKLIFIRNFQKILFFCCSFPVMFNVM